jgi:hypothetical protein
LASDRVRGISGIAPGDRGAGANLDARGVEREVDDGDVNAFIL